MKKILVFWGSNHSESINKQLAIYAASQLEKEVSTSIIDLNDFPLPLFNLETERNFGVPVKAGELQVLLAGFDGYLIAVAEHNGSVTAFFKNVLDWLSRGDKNYGVFGQKPVLLLGTSPGPGGAKGALQHAETIIKKLAGNVISSIPLPLFFNNFKSNESNGEILDSSVKKLVSDAIADLVRSIKTNIPA